MSKKIPFYQHQQVEPHWQKEWENQSLFQDQINHFLQKQTRGEKLDPLYLLFAFAYPSGLGLHVGHVESKTALDILARYYRMQGKDVFFPVGWDAFGLPAENYAIKTGVPPAVTTKQAIDIFRQQIKRLGISYDWAAEIATCHPEYYKFTQWLFSKLYQHHLAYKKMGVVNWCPSCQTVLANEQVVEGQCERCDSQVVQKELEQWYFRITQYQDELIDGLNQLDWPEATKHQQLHWIGKSEGVSIDFRLKGLSKPLTVWTKFWETVFGTTFVVIAPELFSKYELLELVEPNTQATVLAYLEAASKKTEEERKIGEKDKTGVNTGLIVTNPVNGNQVPLYIADYVLPYVGTGVVMGVPAHDERDFLFAKKHSLEVLQVVSYPQLPEIDAQVKDGLRAYSDEGVLINSGQFDGLDAWGEGKLKMAEWMISQGFARRQTTYRLRDWLISRQRYWGAPIPMIYDPDGEPHLIK
ncbi:MAG TPA: class I tRNA ligase family protein, partial [Candidatus Woesebacteria bacterium]|nr:class I tRNA ligase family protein [Candidatus Woesebacteria bacterium]